MLQGNPEILILQVKMVMPQYLSVAPNAQNRWRMAIFWGLDYNKSLTPKISLLSRQAQSLKLIKLLCHRLLHYHYPMSFSRDTQISSSKLLEVKAFIIHNRYSAMFSSTNNRLYQKSNNCILCHQIPPTQLMGNLWTIYFHLATCQIYPGIGSRALRL